MLRYGMIECTKKSKIALKAGLCSVLIPLSFVPNLANAQATIIVTATDNLHFGTVTTGGAGGDITITPSGSRTLSGSLIAVNGAGLSAPGVFSITGSTGFLIDLSMDSTFYDIDDGAGGNMRVDNFNLVTDGGGSFEQVSLGTSTEVFNLGATLTIGGGQGEGTYVGNYTINANYN